MFGRKEITVRELSLLMLGFLRDSNPTEEEIGRAYRKVSLVCHPDMGGSSEMFQALTLAKEYLVANIIKPAVEQPKYEWKQPEYSKPAPSPRPSYNYYQRRQEEDIPW